MSTRLLAPRGFCATPKCTARVRFGKCPRCRGVVERVRDRYRGSRHARGYDNTWGRYSAERLAEYPYCVGYPRAVHGERTVLADVTDHIVPLRVDPDQHMQDDNHQSLCFACHARKTVDDIHKYGVR